MHIIVVAVLLVFFTIMSIVLIQSDSREHFMYSRSTIISKQDVRRGNSPFSELQNLVMVAGHSVFVGNDFSDFENTKSWYLYDYQKGQLPSIIEHIQLGVEIASQDPTSMLLFSGGQTRGVGPLSEAGSYTRVARAANWFGHDRVAHRSFTEEYSRDSLENVLFSLCRFRELTGHYPNKMTVVSFPFKEKRFKNLHREALGFPKERFVFVGDTFWTNHPNEQAPRGEESTASLFAKDPFACSSPLLDKKLGRDPFFVSLSYPEGCPELSHLFNALSDCPKLTRLRGIHRTFPWKE